MDISLSLAVTGLASSVLTELLKLVPALSKNQITASVTAIVVTAVAAYVTNVGGVGFSFSHFAAVMLFAFLNYKLIVQPVTVAIKA